MRRVRRNSLPLVATEDGAVAAAETIEKIINKSSVEVRGEGSTFVEESLDAASQWTST